MTWEKGTGPCGTGCSLSDIGNLGSLTTELASLSWNCTQGCGNSTKLNDVNYYTTTTSSLMSGYEQGENYFLVTLGAGTGPYEFGCVSEFKLPIEDPDEDTMRCRFSTTSECGTACTSNLKGLTVNTENCTLTINATTANGFLLNHYYRVAVTVEDFPDYTIKVGGKLHTNEEPFSSIPLQFTFEIVASTEPCGTNDIQIALPTANNGIRIAYPKGGAISEKQTEQLFESKYFKLFSFISTFVVVSNPAKFKYNQFDDDNNRTDVTRLYGTWADVDNNQYADTLSCSWALNGINGRKLTSAQQCFTPMIYESLLYLDMQECRPNICKMNGTCIDLWHRTTCRCPFGYKRPDCLRIAEKN
ncbi:hypothetical protein KUTeg_024570 [Tegillarca granosa]|uniref:EGF-like domain-containing protein n=1 Tax=Tegillarca granosa TaxID=220873 RepID=A0ABQ9DXN3_TEGGR|nr:hypothetical protein KUTeg_024570 [Tegillarca granosa]